MNMQIIDKTWNVVWECCICKKISSTKEVTLISMLTGLQQTQNGLAISVQPSPICDLCFSTHDLKTEMPPKIHLPSSSDVAKITRKS